MLFTTSYLKFMTLYLRKILYFKITVCSYRNKGGWIMSYLSFEGLIFKGAKYGRTVILQRSGAHKPKPPLKYTWVKWMFLAIFNVLTAELLKIQDFRDATLCRTVSRVRRFLYFQYQL
jgi:hypothetical protein